MEFSVQKLKNEIEDLKQDMKTYQIEVGILEGKIMNHEEDLNALQVHDLPGKGGLSSLDRISKSSMKWKNTFRLKPTLYRKLDGFARA